MTLTTSCNASMWNIQNIKKLPTAGSIKKLDKSEIALYFEKHLKAQCTNFVIETLFGSL